MAKGTTAPLSPAHIAPSTPSHHPRIFRSLRPSPAQVVGQRVFGKPESPAAAGQSTFPRKPSKPIRHLHDVAWFGHDTVGESAPWRALEAATNSFRQGAEPESSVALLPAHNLRGTRLQVLPSRNHPKVLKNHALQKFGLESCDRAAASDSSHQRTRHLLAARLDGGPTNRQPSKARGELCWFHGDRSSTRDGPHFERLGWLMGRPTPGKRGAGRMGAI